MLWRLQCMKMQQLVVSPYYVFLLSPPHLCGLMDVELYCFDISHIKSRHKPSVISLF